ncbi:MAG: type II toxin-antitoxin system VapC family toxin [Pseudomonadota bacterium]
MKVLLDTHVLLWALADDTRLSRVHRDLIGQGTELFVSAATVWEIAIKRAIGKLTAPADIAQTIANVGCRPLAITWRHAEEAGGLPPHHADPFDRLLVAQAMVEGMPLATEDRKIAAYSVEII